MDLKTSVDKTTASSIVPPVLYQRAVTGGTDRGVGLTDGAREQREYSNDSSQFQSSELLQQSRTFAPITSRILKKNTIITSPKLSSIAAIA